MWRFDPSAVEVTHTADLFFRRPDRPGVFGDHATPDLDAQDGEAVLDLGPYSAVVFVPA